VSRDVAAAVQADLPENKAKTVHPELVKFQLEKKARWDACAAAAAAM
jgi:hypothetical protein